MKLVKTAQTGPKSLRMAPEEDEYAAEEPKQRTFKLAVKSRGFKVPLKPRKMRLLKPHKAMMLLEDLYDEVFYAFQSYSPRSGYFLRIRQGHQLKLAREDVGLMGHRRPPRSSPTRKVSDFELMDLPARVNQGKTAPVRILFDIRTKDPVTKIKTTIPMDDMIQALTPSYVQELSDSGKLAKYLHN